MAGEDRGRRLRIAGLAVVAVGVAIQLVPVDRSNPPVESEMPAPPEVREILARACNDCHSNETVWPWYAYVAPVSWLLAHDVHEGREGVNFSTWNRYTPKKQSKMLREIPEDVDEGEMPPWFYLPLHPDARLDDGDREALRRWALAARPNPSSR